MTLRSLISEAMKETDVGIQSLAHCMESIDTSKRGVSRITFGTQALSASNVACDSGPIGLILWIPRKRYDDLLAKYGGATGEGGAK